MIALAIAVVAVGCGDSGSSTGPKKNDKELDERLILGAAHVWAGEVTEANREAAAAVYGFDVPTGEYITRFNADGRFQITSVAVSWVSINGTWYTEMAKSALFVEIESMPNFNAAAPANQCATCNTAPPPPRKAQYTYTVSGDNLTLSTYSGGAGESIVLAKKSI